MPLPPVRILSLLHSNVMERRGSISINLVKTFVHLDVQMHFFSLSLSLLHRRYMGN